MTTPKICPCLSYRDPAAAMQFLEQAFGCSELPVVQGPNGTVTHTEVSFGPEVIMLGSSKPELGWVSPLDLPAVNSTVCVGLASSEAVTAHYAHAVAAGATISRPLRDRCATPTTARRSTQRRIPKGTNGISGHIVLPHARRCRHEHTARPPGIHSAFLRKHHKRLRSVNARSHEHRRRRTPRRPQESTPSLARSGACHGPHPRSA